MVVDICLVFLYLQYNSILLVVDQLHRAETRSSGKSKSGKFV